MINRLAKYTETSICSEVTRDSFLMYWVIHIFNISVFRALDIILFRYIQTRIWIGYIKDIICTEHYTHFCTQCKVSSVKYRLSFRCIQIYVNHLKSFYCKKSDTEKSEHTICSITITKTIAHLWLQLVVKVCQCMSFLFYLLMIQTFWMQVNKHIIIII